MKIRFRMMENCGDLAPRKAHADDAAYDLHSRTDLELEPKLAREELERQTLDAMTTDKVVCGEQQPESDHFVQMEHSYADDDEGTHWREARGWFSYQMKTRGQRPAKVRVRFRPDGSRNALVSLNEVEIGVLDNQPGIAEFEIPVSLRTSDVLTIKVAKGEKNITPRIYEVRLIK